MKKQILNGVKKVLATFLSFALVIAMLPIGQVSVLAEETTPEGERTCVNYPYAINMDQSKFDLCTDESASTYQWQYSSSKNGTYENISGATSATYTVTNAVCNRWYRCLLGDDKVTHSVQAIKVGNSDTYTFLKATSGQWYIGNGTMAYSVWSKNAYFDIVGKYVKDGRTYWMNTSYNRMWSTGFSTSSNPAASNSYFSSDMSSGIKLLKMKFDASNDTTVFVEIMLQNSAHAFTFGTDTQLATSEITNYSDSASLKAVYTDSGALKQVQMVGAASLDDALPTDPAFVFAPVDPVSTYWIGSYGDAEKGYAYKYNTASSSQNYSNLSDGTTYEVKGLDSSMNVSWMNLAGGSSVRFMFNVGTVADTGAVTKATAEVTSTTIIVSAADDDVYYAVFTKDTDTKVKDWVLGTNKNENGELIFEGLDPNTAYVVKTVLKDNKPASGEPDAGNVAGADVTTAIDPLQPDNNESSEPTSVVTRECTYILIENAYENYVYKLLDKDGNVVETKTKGADGNVKFADLAPDSTYYIMATSATNPNSDKVKQDTLQHEMSYQLDGDTIKCACGHSACDYHENDVALTLQVSDASYNGSGYSGATFAPGEVVAWRKAMGTEPPAIQYVGRGDTVYEQSTVAPSQIGTYTAILTLGDQTVTHDFELTQKAMTNAMLSTNQAQYTFTENAITPVLYVKDTVGGVANTALVLGRDYEIDENSVTSATNPGTYTVQVTGKGNYTGTATITWKIVGADFGASDISASNIEETYDGNGHSIEVILSGTSTGGVVTYSEAENGEYTSVNPSVINVTDGAKTVWYQVEKYGYNPVKKYATITINKRDILVKADDLTKHVGSGDPSLTFSVKEGSLVEGESLAMNATRESGENPAEYTITLSQEEGANTNYNITFETGIFTIEDHVSVGTLGKDSTCTEGGYTTGTKCSICGKKLSGNDTGALGHAFSDEYTVDKASTCLETGKKSRHCTRVGCDEITDEQMIEKSGHDWSGEWNVTQKATKKEEGKREKTCALDGCNQKLIEKIPATGENVTDDEAKVAELVGEGSLVKEAELTEEAPFEEVVLESKKSELLEADGIFTDEEKTSIQEGADARVWLEVDTVIVENIESADQEAIEEAVAELIGEDAQLIYFDASLFKQVGNSEREYVHEPGMDIEITITIPENLINTNQDLIRKYSIIRLHENVVDTIEGAYNEETNEYTFVSDKFSVYAIAYKDFPRADLEEEPEEEVIEDDTDVLDEEIVEEEEIPVDTTEDMVEEEAEEQDDDSKGTRVNPPKTGDYEGNPIIENHYMIVWKKEEE